MRNNDSYSKYLAESYLQKLSLNQSKHAATWHRLNLARAKLKASSRTSALLSGFAMVAMVEIDSSDLSTNSGWVIAFSIVTTLVIIVHLLALMVSTCILPNIEASATITQGVMDPELGCTEQLHDRMHFYIEVAWICSTGIGILLFLVQVAILAQIRFKTMGWVCVAMILPAMCVFMWFGVSFYRHVIAHKYSQSTRTIEQCEEMVSDLNNMAVTTSASSTHMLPASPDQ